MHLKKRCFISCVLYVILWVWGVILVTKSTKVIATYLNKQVLGKLHLLENILTNMIPSAAIKEKFAKLHEKIEQFEKKWNEKGLHEIEDKEMPKLNTMRVTLDDIQNGILLNKFQFVKKSTTESLLATATPPKTGELTNPFIKITLRVTEDILLYESRSETALRDTEEGAMVLLDNEEYIYLTEGTGRKRRMGEAETQTNELLLKSREVNTESILSKPKASYVSNFEMFDTYLDLEKSTKSVNVDGKQKIQITTYKVHGVDKFLEINEMPSFKLALMLMMRILAGNVFEVQQRRFRNMHLPDPLALKASYKYTLNLLWRYVPDTTVEENLAVSDMSWCPRMGDILAVAYGIYSHAPGNKGSRDKGTVRIWNIKNPVNPERCYTFHSPVTSVEFSPVGILAIGLLDGGVQVIDISSNSEKPIAISENNSWSCFEPITNIKWLAKSKASVDETFSIEPFLAVSQSGAVIKYSIINSPYLLGFLHISLDRVVGCNLEGIAMPRPTEHVQSNQHPQGLGITLSPVDVDVFYVFTDEGCLHKCSMNYPQQTLAKLQAAEGAVTSMDFSPWSPKVFLTCGNDWCIRIWIDGIFCPIITLEHKNRPVHSAMWSKTHSTNIISLNRQTIDIWDIQHSILKPITSTTIDKPFHTLFKLANCGRSLAVGNEHGNVLMLAIDDLPFTPQFQYKALEKSLFKAIKHDEKLTAELKSIGHFGYSEHETKVKNKN